MQQGGIGLLLPPGIITMRVLAAALWQGSMGSFMAFLAFDRPTASSAAQRQAGGGYILPQGESNTSVPRDSIAAPSTATNQQVTVGHSQAIQQQAPRSRGIAS